MDKTDLEILNLLQEDCRIPLRRIGAQVGLTAPAVSERIRKLEAEGVIRGFHADIDRSKLSCALSGYILVRLDPTKYDQFCALCKKLPVVTEHTHTVGVYNAVLRFALRDVREMEDLLSRIKKYGDSITAISLNSYFERKELTLPESSGSKADAGQDHPA